MRLLIHSIATVAATALSIGGVSAHTFTGKTIRIIVPYAPGGTSDILARALPNKVGESLGATVVVDNKPGANGVLGSDLVAKSTPDATTLPLTDMVVSPAPPHSARSCHSTL